MTDTGPRYVELLESGFALLLSSAPWEPDAQVTGDAPPSSEPLAPVAPSKIVAVGQNYQKHAAEMGKPVPTEPLLFLKAVSALNGPRQPIVLPEDSSEVHHEAELAVIIGRTLRHASEDEAAAGVFGLSCFNDVTARDIQRREVQHTRAKSYDTFACLGPHLVTGVPWHDLRVQCRVNGQLKQDGRTSDMIFAVPRLLSFISRIMTLVPGDVVSTGTPSGVGPLVAGDVVEVDIEQLGTLFNPVRR